MTSLNEDGLITLREAARLLGLHPETVRRWSDSGVIPVYRLGERRDRRFKVSEIQEYIKSTHIDSKSQASIKFKAAGKLLGKATSKIKEV